MSKEVKGRIAIIDDDALVRQTLTDCVESAGYSVEDFGSAEDFLTSSSAKGAVCLIVDIDLPGITGLELQRRLAGKDNRAPIVFVTGQAANGNREQAIRQGAAGFLCKPFRREELLIAIKAATQH